MPSTSCIQPLEHYLRMTTTGSLESAEELMGYVALVDRMAREYDTNRILVDETRLTLMADLLDTCVFAESDLAQDMISRGVRVACLPGPARREFLRGVETILNNRSFSFRVFDAEDAAVAWLTR